MDSLDTKVQYSITMGNLETTYTFAGADLASSAKRGAGGA
jgi:hypothetical protein